MAKCPECKYSDSGQACKYPGMETKRGGKVFSVISNIISDCFSLDVRGD